MALKTITVTIGDQSYSVTNLQTTESLKFFRKLLEIFKGSVPHLVSVLEGDENKAGEALPQLAAALADKLGETDIETLIKDLICKSVQLGGQPFDPSLYEVQFAGSFDVLLRLLMEVIKHNYMSLLKVGGTEVKVTGN